MNLFDLTGRTAVIIGGNSTLGSGITEAIGAYGANVAIVGRNLVKCKEVCERIIKNGGKAKSFYSDATQSDDLKNVLSEVLAWKGRVDILMNCPGMNSTTSFFELTMDEWDSIMDVNLKSIVLACQIFGKQMVDQGDGGSIINISSVSSGPPLSKVITYSTSKAAVNSVTQFLAREFAPHRIRVNAIIPGFFPAEQNRKILSPERTNSILGHSDG